LKKPGTAPGAPPPAGAGVPRLFAPRLSGRARRAGNTLPARRAFCALWPARALAGRRGGARLQKQAKNKRPKGMLTMRCARISVSGARFSCANTPKGALTMFCACISVSDAILPRANTPKGALTMLCARISISDAILSRVNMPRQAGRHGQRKTGRARPLPVFL